MTVPSWCFFCGSFFVIYVSCLSLLCCLVCSLPSCDHLMGKSSPLCPLVCDFPCVFSLFYMVSHVRCGTWLYHSWYLPSYLLCLLDIVKLNTGQPRYLNVQGNGKNTSSYHMFDISKMWRHPNMMYMFNFSKTYFYSACVVKLFLLNTR